VFPPIELRHLRAATVLAEELNYTRAAHRMHISQPALSRQITELEEKFRFHLFTRDKRRGVELTEAGRSFIEEAGFALLHAERAVHLAREIHEGSDRSLMIGHSPSAEPSWISTILAVHLPLYPTLRIRLTSQFPLELVRSVLASELSLALVTHPPIDSQITSVPFVRAPLYAILPETHRMARKEHIALRDIGQDDWIVFSRRIHPVVHAAIMEAAQGEGITPKCVHDAITAEHAAYLVSENVGVAILTGPCSVAFRVEGVVVKPLSDNSLWFETCMVMRAHDDSALVNEFARTFLRKFGPQRVPPRQMELTLRA
jgi:DNA-binding transcriptional LysR family regulator